MTPDTAIAVTFNIDHLEVRTKILTRIAIGIIVRINVGQPKRTFNKGNDIRVYTKNIVNN